MEYIKKKILQATTTGTTTGCTGTCRVIIPNTGVTYHINFSLTQNIQDIGFFDAYIVPPLTSFIVITSTLSSLASTGATGGGAVFHDGGSLVTARGVVWDINPSPTTGNTRTYDGIGIGPYVSYMTGLTTLTTYYVRAYAINSSGVTYGQTITFTTLGLATISTNVPTLITTTGATGGGNVSDDGGSLVTARGIAWSTTHNPTIANIHTSDGTDVGTFTSYLTGLTSATLYYVRAYAVNGIGIAYGNEFTFTTLTPSTLPVVTTANISSITQTTATGGGNVTYDGNATVTARGVVWGTSHNPTTANNETIDGSGTGVFTSSLTILAPNTVYYVRAYATNSVGTGYGNEVTFTSNPVLLPTVTTANISSITQTTASGGGSVTSDGGATVTAYGIVWNTLGSPTTADSKTIDGTGTGTFTSSLTGLVSNQTYYVRAYATNSAGTAYGNQVAFITLETYFLLIACLDNNENYYTTIGESPTLTDGDLVEAGTGFYYHVNGTTNTLPSGRIDLGTVTNLGSGPCPTTTTTTTITYASIITLPITLLSFTSAQSGGNILSTGGASITGRGIAWNTSGHPTILDNHTSDGPGGLGAFISTILSGLVEGTTYYVKAYATNSWGTTYGNELSFTVPTIPSVTTNAITNISQPDAGDGTATGGGNVTSDGGTPVTAYGVVWNNGGNPTIGDNKTIDGSGVGTFTSILTNLIGARTYFVRAYATNNAGTGYGGQVNFSTPEQYYLLDPCDNPGSDSYTTTRTESKHPDGSNLNDGDLVQGGTGFYYHVVSTSSSPFPGTIDIVVTFVSAGGPCPSTTTTTTVNVPAITTQPIITITQTSAESGGIVTSYGGTSIICSGIVWNTGGQPIIQTDCHTCDGVTGPTTGIFTSCMFGLIAGITYHVKAYAENSVGTAYGSECCFTIPSVPIVTTASISSISAYSAIGGGNVICDGGAAITQRGVVWTHCNCNPVYPSDSCSIDGSGAGAYTSCICGLSPTQNYYVRAYAINCAGINYGSLCTFTTPAPPSAICVYVLTSCSSPWSLYGAFCLVCSNGTKICAQPIASGCHFSCVVPSGCYYVDYSGANLCCNNMPKSRSGINTSICNSIYGSSYCTVCFTFNATANAVVCGCIY